MWQVFKIFLRAEGTRPFLVLFCLLIGGVLEAVGIGTLLPAFSALMNTGNGDNSPFEMAVRSVLAWFGLGTDFGTLLAVAVTFLILRAFLLFGAMTYSGITGARVANRLRTRLIKAVFDARWSYYADQSSGRLASNISSDAAWAGEAYRLSAVATSFAIQIIAYILVALLVNWRVAVTALAGGAIIALVSRRIINISRRASYKQSDRTALLTADMVDLVQNVKSLKAMHRYDRLIEGLALLVKRLRRTLYAQNYAKYGLMYGNDVLTVVILASVAWYAVTISKIPVQQLFVIGILFFQVLTYISKCIKQVQAASQLEGSYVRLTQQIKLAEQQKEEVGGGLAPPNRADFHFRNIAFAYGEKAVLKNVTLTIAANHITVLQGPSGTGKTTLIDLLIGLHRPQSGSILLGTQNLLDTDITAFRRTLGYVPQELALFHDTIRENISLSEPGISDADILQALKLAGAADFIANLPNGLDSDVGEFGGKLSGGQRQRISLARALVRKPEVLILDEVTSALDPETEAAIVENIASLRGRYTIIAITHRPAWTEIADTVFSFAKGEVKKSATKRRKTRA